MTGHEHAFKDIITDVVFLSSLSHSLLPPWDAEVFAPFPTFQKYYKVLVYVIGFMGLNARSTVYRSISTEKVGGVNERERRNG